MINITKSRRLAAGVAAAASIACLGGLAAPSTATQPVSKDSALRDPTTEDIYSPMAEAVDAAIAANQADAPRKGVQARLTGEDDPDGKVLVSDDDLRVELEAQGATDVRIVPDAETDGEILAERGGLPSDLFKVRGSWATYIQDRKQYIAFYGRWNYRNDVIGSGNPDDIAGIAVKNFSSDCWRNTSSGLRTQDQDGRRTNLRTRYDANHANTTWKVHDDTSGFQLLTDVGFAWIEMRRDALGCDRDKQGKFFHEHNQSGNGSWNIGVNVLVFTVEYSGDSGMKLRKATAIKYLDYSE